MKNNKTKIISIYLGAVLVGLLTVTISGAIGANSGISTGNIVSGKVRILSVKELEPNIKEDTKKDIAETRRKGYVTIEDDSVLTADDLRKKDKLISTENLQSKTKFEIHEPFWLPIGAKIDGGAAGGPTEEGPWNSVRIYYSTASGDFSIEEWDMSDGEVVMVDEMMNDTINGKKASGQKSKLRKSGKEWYSLSFVNNGHLITISGNISSSIAKRIAESI